MRHFHTTSYAQMDAVIRSTSILQDHDGHPTIVKVNIGSGDSKFDYMRTDSTDCSQFAQNEAAGYRGSLRWKYSNMKPCEEYSWN